MSDEITPFRIQIPEAALRDLRERLERTRWPDEETVTDWSQGVPRAYMREFCDYWAKGYDWRATEARLNALPQFRTEIDGLGIHFLHVRSPHPDALPLVITHGWPGSIIEFLKVIELLTDPTTHGGNAADAFHVVCPSLPGYGFSDKPVQRGWGVERIATAWTRLMARLGRESVDHGCRPWKRNPLPLGRQADDGAVHGGKLVRSVQSSAPDSTRSGHHTPDHRPRHPRAGPARQGPTATATEERDTSVPAQRLVACRCRKAAALTRFWQVVEQKRRLAFLDPSRKARSQSWASQVPRRLAASPLIRRAMPSAQMAVVIGTRAASEG
jgi:Epoxide hydrolase N terminus